jgi:hypothetical protein
LKATDDEEPIPVRLDWLDRSCPTTTISSVDFGGSFALTFRECARMQLLADGSG